MPTVKFRWPLCFVSPIIRYLSPGMPAAERIHCLIDKLAVDSSKTYTGLDWEVIVQVAILLRCLGAYFRDNDLQFLGGYGTTTVAGVECITIPREYQTLDDAHAYMVEECIRTTRSAAANVFYVTPQFSSFPDYDAFLLVKDSDVTTRIIGLQMKLIRRFPNRPVPSWMEAAYLIRGGAPTAVADLKGKW